jgi:hypothetical protein
MRSRRRPSGGGGEGNGVVVAIACVALAVTFYLVGTLVWQLEDEDETPGLGRFSQALD